MSTLVIPTITYNKIIKRNDAGDVFRIEWAAEQPSEFEFTADSTCNFFAEHLTNLDAKFNGVGTVDVETRIGEYKLKASDTTTTGSYKFEFKFNDSNSSYIQTYPKDEELTFQITEALQ